MNDIQIREVLHQHAGSVRDHAQPDRVAAVRRRVRVVRRRRRAGVAVAAVAVVVAGTLAVTLPRRHPLTPADAPAKMIGRAVPKTTESYGASYDYARGYVGKDGRVTVRLPQTDRGVLVRVASEHDGGKLALRAKGRPAWVLPGGSFGTFQYVDPSVRTITLDGRGATGPVALAVYTLARPAPGFTVDGITYPDAVARQPLLGAFIGKSGADRGSVRLTPTVIGPTQVSVTVFVLCSGVPKGSMVSVDLGSGPVQLGGCTASAPADPTHGGGSVTVEESNRELTATVGLVNAHGRRIAVPAGGRIGVGIYGPTVNPVTMEGLTPTIDEGGHTLRLDSTSAWTSRIDTWRRVQVDATRPVLVAYGTGEPGSSGYLQVRIDDRRATTSGGGGVTYEEWTTDHRLSGAPARTPAG